MFLSKLSNLESCLEILNGSKSIKIPLIRFNNYIIEY